MYISSKADDIRTPPGITIRGPRRFLKSCPLFDGVTSYADLWSAGLASDALANLIANPGFETPGTATNMLNNGDFELAGGHPPTFLSWADIPNSGTITDETTLVHSGGHAVKLTVDACVEQDAVVVPGTVYQLTMWTRGDGVNAGQYAIWDATHAALIISGSTNNATTTYQLFSVAFTPPAGCVLVTVILEAVIGTDYFDDVSLESSDLWASWAENPDVGVIADDAVVFHTGAHSAKLTCGAALYTTYVVQNIATVPGVTYNFSYWIKCNGTYGTYIDLYDVVNAAHIWEDTAIRGTSWVKASHTFTAPAGCTNVNVGFFAPLSAGGIAWFDDANLHAVYGGVGFNGEAGTLVIWGEVKNASVWTDGLVDRLLTLGVDANNYVDIQHFTDHAIGFEYTAGGVASGYYESSVSDLTFMCLVISWDAAADAVKFYHNKVLLATHNGLGTWAGALVAAKLGSDGVGGWNWPGLEAHCILWSKALTPAQVAWVSDNVLAYQDRILAMEPASLVAYWPMDEDAGPTVVDHSGHGYDGTYHSVTVGHKYGIGDEGIYP